MAQAEPSSLTVRHRFSASTSSSPSFLSQLGLGGGLGGDLEIDVVGLDHCYSKPWSAHPDASSARPMRMLFMPKQTRPSALDAINRNVDMPIDVVDVPPTPSMPFDISKARSLMTECERHASYARSDSNDDWEDKISKSGWTVQQTRLFTKVMKILHSDRLARLAMESIANEPIARRQVVDKTAKRMRQALASVGWDTDVVQWLHQLILDNLSVHLLACYLDAMQTLKAKVPALVEKMISGPAPKHPSLSHESLGLLLKRPWDPVGSILTQQKLKKLPGNPLLLIAPSGPSQSGSSHTGQARRLKFWQVHLNSLGKTIPTNMSGGGGVGVVLCLEQMIGALRTKVLEQKSHHPGRPIILMGWNIGALVACHVSLIESVNAVVCLGFPFTGLHGPRGDCEDPLLGSQTPTLFVVGQHASDCSVEQLQDLREHMKGETSMVVVGGADQQLRLSHRHKREEGLTQAMADRCIIDEVYQFLGSILSMNAGLPDLPPAELPPVDMRRKRKRKATPDVTTCPTPTSESPAFTPVSTPTPSPASTRGGLLGSGRGSRRGGKARGMATSTPNPNAGGRPGPRRRGGRGSVGGPSARKRMALGTLGALGMSAVAAGSRPSHASPTSLHPPGSAGGVMAAISSAPELSGLLQGIRITRPSEGESVVVGGRSLVGSAPLALTKVLTFSKVMEGAGDAGSGVAGPATLLASAVRDPEKERSQFLVKAGVATTTSLAFPLSMQRLVGGSSPLVHITGASSSSSSSTTATSIQQLLTSMAGSRASSAPHTALLINTTTATTTPTTVHHTTLHSTAAAPPREKAVSGKPDPPELGDKGVKKNIDKDRSVATASSAVKSDSLPPPTPVPGVSSVPATTVAVSQHKLSAAAAESGQTAGGQQLGQDTMGMATVVSLSSMPLLSSSLAGKVAMVKKASLPVSAGSLGTLTLAKAPVSHSHSSAVDGGSRSSSQEGGVAASIHHQSGGVVKPGFVQLTAAKSLINSVSAPSILRVAGSLSGGSAGHGGSPSVTSSILGRGAVLITPTMHPRPSPATPTSTPTAILLNKSGSTPGVLTSASAAASYRPNLEMLGKVTSVLEPPGGTPRPRTQAPRQQPVLTTAAAIVTSGSTMVPVTVSRGGVLTKASMLTKCDVINALKAAKPASSPVPTIPAPSSISSPPPPPSPIPLCVSSPFPQSGAPLASSVVASLSSTSSSGSGGGREGNKSVSYTASSKSVLPSATSTRTRKIKTPKQYDL